MGILCAAFGLPQSANADQLIGIGGSVWAHGNLRGPYSALAIYSSGGAIGLRTDGSVTCWGSDGGLRTSATPQFQDVVQVATGFNFSMVRRSSGVVEAFGDQPAALPGDLGPCTDIACGSQHALAVRADGSVRCWGDNSYGQCNVPVGLGTAVQVAGGDSVSAARLADGKVRCWGDNSSGQCNVPPTLPAAKQVGVSTYFACALLTTGEIKTWGSWSSTAPTAPSPIRAISVGFSHIVGLLEDGSVKCWGENLYGSCVVPPELGPVIGIAAGSHASFAVRADGSIAAWGPGALTCGPQETAVTAQVAASAEGYVIRTIDGSVQACGMATGLGPVPLDAFPSMQVAYGGSHAISLRTDGWVVCWGSNAQGQCNWPDLSPYVLVAAGSSHSAGVRADGVVRCWGSNYAGERNVPAGLGAVAQIVAGDRITAVRQTDGRVVVWGTSSYGQTNVPHDLPPSAQIAVGAQHMVSLGTNGTVRAWGSNWSGQCTVPTDLGQVKQVAAGKLFSAALRSDGTVRAWGDPYSSAIPTNLPFIRAIAATPRAGLTFGLIDPCPGDLDGDGTVGGSDLGTLLGAWGTANEAADLNHDGTVSGPDLGILLGHWGACP